MKRLIIVVNTILAAVIIVLIMDMDDAPATTTTTTTPPEPEPSGVIVTHWEFTDTLQDIALGRRVTHDEPFVPAADYSFAGLRRPLPYRSEYATTFYDWCLRDVGEPGSPRGATVGPWLYDVYNVGLTNPDYARGEVERIAQLGDGASLHQRRHVELLSYGIEDNAAGVGPRWIRAAVPRDMSPTTHRKPK